MHSVCNGDLVRRGPRDLPIRIGRRARILVASAISHQPSTISHQVRLHSAMRRLEVVLCGAKEPRIWLVSESACRRRDRGGGGKVLRGLVGGGAGGPASNFGWRDRENTDGNSREWKRLKRERERGQRACTRESVASRAREVETRCA